MSKKEFERLAKLATLEGTPEVVAAFTITAVEPIVQAAIATTARPPKRSALATKVALALARDAKTPFGPRGQAVLAAWQADLAAEQAAA